MIPSEILRSATREIFIRKTFVFPIFVKALAIGMTPITRRCIDMAVYMKI
jgi:hypothetical protein